MGRRVVVINEAKLAKVALREITGRLLLLTRKF